MHHKTIKSSSITPPCSHSTTQSNPDRSFPRAFAPQNNQIQLHHSHCSRATKQPNPTNRSPMLWHQKTTESSLITPSNVRAPQSNQIQLSHPPKSSLSQHKAIKSSSILPQGFRTNRQSDSSSITPACSGTTKQSNPTLSLPNALVLHNNQIAPIDNQIPAQSLPQCNHSECSCKPQQPNRINRQSNSRSITHAPAPQNNHIQLNHSQMLLYYKTTKSNQSQPTLNSSSITTPMLPHRKTF